MPPAATAIAALAETLGAQSPQDILAFALKEYSPSIGIAFSGAEDVVLIDMAARLGVPFTVFSLDTGRLHPETYQFIEKVRTHYGITIETMFPDAAAVQRLVHAQHLVVVSGQVADQPGVQRQHLEAPGIHAGQLVCAPLALERADV